MTLVEIDSAYRSVFDALKLTTFATVQDHFVAPGDEAEYGVLLKYLAVAQPGRDPLLMYFKQYEQADGSWRYFLQYSKARCEYLNYQFMAEVGLRTARRVAWGEQRDRLGRLQRAFIITEAVPDSRTLIEHFGGRLATRSGHRVRQQRITLLRALGATIREMHDQHFFHHDLVWRNLLVTAGQSEHPQVWWIDCPRGGYDRGSPRRRRKLLRDLGSFDKHAGRQCTLAERLAFFLAYCGRSRLDQDSKALIRDVMAYSQRRWWDRP